MAAISPLQKLLLALHRLLAAVSNPKHIPRALAAILHRLLIWWTNFRSKWRIWQKKKALPTTPTCGPPKIHLNEPKAVGSVDDQEKEKESGGGNTTPPQLRSEHIPSSSPYDILDNGESVSLDDVACSLHPYSNKSKGASRSSLRLAKASHHLDIVARNASRSSQNLDSHYSHSIRSGSEAPPCSDDGHGYTIGIEPSSPRLPAPRRQFSTSLPDLQTHSPISIPRALASPSIEVVSPRDGPTSITYTRSESPMPFPHLDNPHIWPAVPEYSTRYNDRPIM